MKYEYFIACVILLALQFTEPITAQAYGCGRNVSYPKLCDIVPLSQIDGVNLVQVDTDMCWGLAEGKRNQPCNLFERNTGCQLNCTKPICGKTGHQCPNNKVNKGNILIGLFSDYCHMVMEGYRVATFYKREPTLHEFTVVPLSECEGLGINKVYHIN